MKTTILAVLALALGVTAFTQRPLPKLQLALVNLNGDLQDVGLLPISTFAPRISPNGRQLAFDTQENGSEIWIADFPSLKSLRRLPSEGQYPMWSIDNERIFYITAHNGQQALYWRLANGAGAAELLVEPARAPEHWLPKTQSITYITLKNGDYDVWRYSLADKKAAPLVELARSSQHSSRVSPNERWLAYVSDETGRFEVYVQPLQETGTKIQLTKDGGEHPVWAPDGREIYYNRGDRLYSISVNLENSLTIGKPTALPISGFIQDVGRRQFEITADGKQFLMLFPPR
ncbi:MAG TPA: hypothetical protein VK210_16505 [Terriglobia bacterium]|nr:hypothetical protein [Terriglobia bacterium]